MVHHQAAFLKLEEGFPHRDTANLELPGNQAFVQAIAGLYSPPESPRAAFAPNAISG